MNLRLLSLIFAFGLLAGCTSTTEMEGALPPDDMSAAAEDAGTTGMDTLPEVTSEDFIQYTRDRVFFNFDRATLSPEAIQTLRAQAKWLKANVDAEVVIEGHCDERGTREYNLALGERRAQAVKDYLISLGVSSERLRTISFGKEQPAVMGSNEAAWAQNRRAVTVIK